MKRKVYESDKERYADRRRGAVLFLGVNGLVLLLYFFLQAQLKQAAPDIYFEDQERYARYIQLIPWVVNGLVLLPALIWRSELAAGYLSCIGLILVAGVGLTVLFWVSCVAGLGIGVIFGPAGSVIGVSIFITLFLVGVVWGLVQIVGLAKEWWDVR